MLKAVILDLDGVIVDSHPVHIEVWKTLLARVGVISTEQELQIVREGLNKVEILRYFFGELSPEQIRFYSEQKDSLYRDKASEVKTVAGIKPFLRSLQRAGVPTVVASGGSYGRVHDALDRLRLTGYFAAVVTGDEFQRGKADPGIFLKAVTEIGVSCEETLVFEDSEAGIRSGRLLGMTCIGIADASRAKALLDAGAERILPNFLNVSPNELHRLFTSRLGRKFALRHVRP